MARRLFVYNSRKADDLSVAYIKIVRRIVLEWRVCHVRLFIPLYKIPTTLGDANEVLERLQYVYICTGIPGIFVQLKVLVRLRLIFAFLE